MRVALVAGVCLAAAGCALEPVTGSWSNSDGASVTANAGRVVFTDVPVFVPFESCTEPVRLLSGEGRDFGEGGLINVTLDDPMEWGSSGDGRLVSVVFVPNGPSWDLWREIGIVTCDGDAPQVLLQRD